MHHCEAKARATLNTRKFTELAARDAARAHWSGTRLARERRRAENHLANCLPCLLASLPSSQTPVSVPT